MLEALLAVQGFLLPWLQLEMPRVGQCADPGSSLIDPGCITTAPGCPCLTVQLLT